MNATDEHLQWLSRAADGLGAGISLLASDLPQDRVEEVCRHLCKIAFVVATVATNLGGDELLANLAEEMAQPET